MLPALQMYFMAMVMYFIPISKWVTFKCHVQKLPAQSRWQASIANPAGIYEVLPLIITQIQPLKSSIAWDAEGPGWEILNTKMQYCICRHVQLCAPCHGIVLYSFWYWLDVGWFFINFWNIEQKLTKICFSFHVFFEFYIISNIFRKHISRGGGGEGTNSFSSHLAFYAISNI